MTSKDHICQKEGEIAEIKQMMRSFSNNEQRTYNNWHDIKILEEKVGIYEKRQEDIIDLIREINTCQQKLIIETSKTNQTFEHIKYLIGVIPVACAVISIIVSILH